MNVEILVNDAKYGIEFIKGWDEYMLHEYAYNFPINENVELECLIIKDKDDAQTVKGCVIFTDSEWQDRIILYSIYIDTKFRNQGLGGMLISKIENIAHERHRSYVEMMGMIHEYELFYFYVIKHNYWPKSNAYKKQLLNLIGKRRFYRQTPYYTYKNFANRKIKKRIDTHVQIILKYQFDQKFKHNIVSQELVKRIYNFR